MPSALLFHVEHRAPQLERYYEAGCRPFPGVTDALSLHLRAAQHAESMGQTSIFSTVCRIYRKPNYAFRLRVFHVKHQSHLPSAPSNNGIACPPGRPATSDACRWMRRYPRMTA